MRTISMGTTFQRSPATVFPLFMDSSFLGTISGSKASIRPEVGSKYRVGGCIGRILHIEKNQLLVRTMHFASWPKGEGEAVSIFHFQKSAAGTELSVVLVGVPEAEVEAVKTMVSASLGAMKAQLQKPPLPSEPRRRGRPPKSAGNGAAAGSRRRGRPPKNESGQSGGPALPKRRGRPPKVSSGETAVTIPRKRGRPPKNPAAAALPAAPRKRGRPPKASGTAAGKTGSRRSGRPPKTA